MGRKFDQESWDRRWAEALEKHVHVVEQRPPSAHLIDQTADLQPGRALDAGAGHGADALWLAAQGWHVTAVDFSVTALEWASKKADSFGEEIADRVEWIAADLTTWAPPAEHYDLVACLYVHVAGSVPELVLQLAEGVAPGGTLLLVGHQPIDPVTGKPTPAADQVQIDVDSARAALEPDGWEILVAEERKREQAGSGVDAVIRARRPVG